MYEINRQAFSDRLTELMYRNHLKPASLSAELNIPLPTISRYLSCDRNPSLEYVVLISQHFEVTVEWLLGISDSTTSRLTDEADQVKEKYLGADQRDRLIVRTVLGLEEDKEA